MRQGDQLGGQWNKAGKRWQLRPGRTMKEDDSGYILREEQQDLLMSPCGTRDDTEVLNILKFKKLMRHPSKNV